MHQFSNWENFSFDSWPWGSSGRGSAGNRPRQRAGGGGARGIFNEVLEKMQKARRKGPGPSEGRILGDRGERADAEPRGAAHTAMNAARPAPVAVAAFTLAEGGGRTDALSSSVREAQST